LSELKKLIREAPIINNKTGIGRPTTSIKVAKIIVGITIKKLL